MSEETTYYSPLEYLLRCKSMYDAKKAASIKHHVTKKKNGRKSSGQPAKKKKRCSPAPTKFAFDLADWPFRLSGLRVPSIDKNELTWVTVLAKDDNNGRRGVFRVVLYDVTKIEHAYEGLDDPYYTFDETAAQKLSLKPNRLYTENPGCGTYDEVPLFHPDDTPVTDLFQRISALRMCSNT